MVDANSMFFSVLKFLFICLEVVLLFNLLIIVHELGHFLAARWRGLVVEKFAIWFGKPIWSKTIGGVEYRIGSIPAGGFVAIPQLAPMEALEGKTETDRADLPPAKPLDKIIVAAAGPVFSMGLAFFMAVIVWLVGRPESESSGPFIGYVEKGGPAENAGIQVGDQVLSVDGKPVSRFMGGTDSIQWRVIRSEGETIPFDIRRNDQVLTIQSKWVKPPAASWMRPALRQVQIGPFVVPGVGFVIPKSAAAIAGFQPNDVVRAVDGTPVSQIFDLDSLFNKNVGRTVTVQVERHGALQNLSIPLPAGTKDVVFKIGIEWGRVVFTHPTPWRQVSDAATSIFRMVGALLSPKSDVKAAHFSGPVGILTLYYKVFASDFGWQLALSLSVLINVNLALINLVPFPVLDGGHILLAIVEGIRRRPINGRILEVVQTACAMVVIGFMLYVTFFDVGDFFTPKGKPEATETKPAK